MGGALDAGFDTAGSVVRSTAGGPFRPTTGSAVEEFLPTARLDVASATKAAAFPSLKGKRKIGKNVKEVSTGHVVHSSGSRQTLKRASFEQWTQDDHDFFRAHENRPAISSLISDEDVSINPGAFCCCTRGDLRH